MRLLARRSAADAALADVERARSRWRVRTRALRAWGDHHRAGLVVGGGFIAGLAVARWPIAPLLRLASTAASAVSVLLEGSLLQLLDTGARGARRNAGEAPTESP